MFILFKSGLVYYLGWGFLLVLFLKGKRLYCKIKKMYTWKKLEILELFFPNTLVGGKLQLRKYLFSKTILNLGNIDFFQIQVSQCFKSFRDNSFSTNESSWTPVRPCSHCLHWSSSRWKENVKHCSTKTQSERTFSTNPSIKPHLQSYKH